ncbi:thrombospondin type-1 domain-containing protein 4-like [Sparus aurata]|nr:thrombospondin type-1 domain-containing protein 4-like [Sparus aurata]
MKSTTIQAYISGINFFTRLTSGAPCQATSHSHITMLIKGLRKTEVHTPPKRSPLTSDLLIRCIRTLRSGYSSPYVDKVLESMFLLAFFGFLRCSEFTASTSKYNPSCHASISDISNPSTDTLIYNLKCSKTNQSGPPQPIYLFRLDSYISPFEPLQEYINSRLASRASPQDPLFVTEIGKIATRHWFHRHPPPNPVSIRNIPRSEPGANEEIGGGSPTQRLHTHSVPPVPLAKPPLPWEASQWSECSVSCGPGVQQRQLQCRQSFGNRSTMVHPQRCASLTPPDSTQACQLRLCSHWEVSSDWSTCSVDCGVGRRTRSVRCVSDQGNIVNDKDCSSRARPQGSEECNMGPCVTNWYFTNWSNTCSAQCGPGVQKREVVCLTRGGVREGGGGGDCVGDKPAEMKACNKGPCVASTMWYSSPWTQCNVQCGNGTQRRDIICVQKTGNDFTVVPATECAHLDKPAAVQECEMGECEPQWFTTEWSACSRSCGKGLQMREVRCLTPDKKHSHDCDLRPKPEQEQICNTIPCSPQVSDENCRDKRHNCVMVVQARLCVYSYYKSACCASCTQSAQRAKRH